MAELPYFFGEGRREPGKRMAWVMAICVHLLLAAFLIYGVRWQSSAPETVSVELVSSVPAVAARPPPPAPPPKPEPEPVQKQEEPPREEPPPPRKADILRKEPEKPKVVKPPIEKPAPPKEKPKEPPKEKARFDPVAKMLERETQRLEQSKMAAAVASTLASLKPNASAASPNKGLADYLAKIRGKIRGNIVLPQSINGNPESVFIVTQLPSGEVLSVKLKTSSGNPALDSAVERAILKSSPLPKPDNPGLFSRELEIKYRPLEE